MNFCAPLIMRSSAEINSAGYRPFFAHLGAQKVMKREFLKHHFKSDFDDILQHFPPQQFYPIHLRVNKLEKENPIKT